MARMFEKFAYHPISEWENVIPEPMSSAKLYYLFTSLGKDNYNRKLKELQNLYEIEWEEDYFEYDVDTYDDYEDYEDYDDEEDYWEESSPEEVKENKVVPRRVLDAIFSVQTAKELGYFLFDWRQLQDQGLVSDSDVQQFYNWQNDKKCRMLFIYGANDPWTGAAIPDPAADDPYVKKYIVPNGLHSGHLKRSEHYSQNDKDYIINTIRRMMANAN